jgi:hypothetical protein
MQKVSDCMLAVTMEWRHVAPITPAWLPVHCNSPRESEHHQVRTVWTAIARGNCEEGHERLTLVAQQCVGAAWALGCGWAAGPAICEGPAEAEAISQQWVGAAVDVVGGLPPLPEDPLLGHDEMVEVARGNGIPPEAPRRYALL